MDPYIMSEILKRLYGSHSAVAHMLGTTVRSYRRYRSEKSPWPGPILRLMQCLIEQVEVTHDT